MIPNSPLFKMASKAIRQSTRQAFRGSALGKVLSAAERASKYGLRYEGRLNSTLKRYRSMTPQQMIRDALGTEFSELVHAVEHYSRGPGSERFAIDEFLKALGPAGDLIRSVVKAASGSQRTAKEVELAKEFLQAFGQLPTLPKAVTKAATGAGTKREGLAGYTTEELLAELQARGEPVEKPKPKPSPFPFGVPEKTRAGAERKVVELPMASGANRRFPADHPIVTGAMQSVTNSSNVHSYGYDIEAAKLYVRFLHTDQSTDRVTQAAGSLYAYSDVEPELFLDLHKKSSKGNWIWDNLRIRGTVSGHRKDYQLVGITHEYVPRKATLDKTGREIFLPRRVRTNQGRWLRSERGLEVVPDVFSGVNAAINRGQANTGRPKPPNSGAAGTSRPGN